MATTKRRYQPTDDEKRERAEQDARFRAEADRVLSDPVQVAQLVDRLLTSGLGPTLLGYSLRNQALVLNQAQERGIPLTDVAGKVAWNKRGRLIRGPGLRITRPIEYRTDRNGTKGRGETTRKASGPGIEIELVNPNAGGEDGGKRPRFRMMSVWNRSQTTAGDWAGKEVDDPTPVADAARVLLDNVTDQLTRRGYTLVVDPATAGDPGRFSQIDHDARTVAVSADWTARDRLLTLTLGLAQVLTLPIGASVVGEVTSDNEDPS